MNRWYAVRCCCKPVKIFGFLLLNIDERNSYEVGVYKKIKEDYQFSNAIGPREAVDILENAAVRLQLMRYGNADELAIYSDDKPIEFWREIDGFIENKAI